MNDELLGGLMNSLAACAVDETIRISLPLTSSSLKNIENNQVCSMKTPKNNTMEMSADNLPQALRRCSAQTFQVGQAWSCSAAGQTAEFAPTPKHQRHHELASQAGVDILILILWQDEVGATVRNM